MLILMLDLQHRRKNKDFPLKFSRFFLRDWEIFLRTVAGTAVEKFPNLGGSRTMKMGKKASFVAFSKRIIRFISFFFVYSMN